MTVLTDINFHGASLNELDVQFQQTSDEHCSRFILRACDFRQMVTVWMPKQRVTESHLEFAEKFAEAAIAYLAEMRRAFEHDVSMEDAA